MAERTVSKKSDAQPLRQVNLFSHSNNSKKKVHEEGVLLKYFGKDKDT